MRILDFNNIIEHTDRLFALSDDKLTLFLIWCCSDRDMIKKAELTQISIGRPNKSIRKIKDIAKKDIDWFDSNRDINADDISYKNIYNKHNEAYKHRKTINNMLLYCKLHHYKII